MRNLAEHVFLYQSRIQNLIQYRTLDFFRIVDVEITTMCNRSCGYCPVSTQSAKKKKTMDMSTYHRLINQLKTLSFRGELNFGGYGEPLLDRRIFDMLRIARGRLPRSVLITVHTNGDFFNDEHLEYFEKHDIRAYITLHDDNEQSRYFFERFSGHPNVFIRYNPSEDYLTTRGGAVDVKKKEIKRICVHAPLMLKVNSSGDVVICAEDFHSQNTFGNINGMPLLDIWTLPEYSRIRKGLASGNPELQICEHCFSR